MNNEWAMNSEFQSIDEQEIYEYVPKGANAAAFVLGRNDSVRDFISLVAREMTDKNKALQRAILIFEKGISSVQAKQIIINVGKAIEEISPKSESGKDIHIKGLGNRTRKEIKALARHYHKQGKTQLWYNKGAGV